MLKKGRLLVRFVFDCCETENEKQWPAYEVGYTMKGTGEEILPLVHSYLQLYLQHRYEGEYATWCKQATLADAARLYAHMDDEEGWLCDYFYMETLDTIFFNNIGWFDTRIQEYMRTPQGLWVDYADYPHIWHATEAEPPSITTLLAKEVEEDETGPYFLYEDDLPSLDDVDEVFLHTFFQSTPPIHTDLGEKDLPEDNPKMKNIIISRLLEENQCH